MTSTIRQRKYKRRTTDRGEYGIKPHILDRRKKALALRAQGYSYRAIAEALGIDSALAWRDCTQALEQLATDDAVEAVKAELLEIHRLATGALVEDIENQRQYGQVETIQQPDGSIVTRTKNWLNTQTLAELGRTCARIASLLGIGNGTDPEATTHIGPSTVVNLIAPHQDGAAFSLRAQELALQQQTIDVTTAAQQLPEEPPTAASETPSEPIPAQQPSEDPTAAPEPRRRSMRTAADRAASSAARRAAAGG